MPIMPHFNIYIYAVGLLSCFLGGWNLVKEPWLSAFFLILGAFLIWLS